MKKRIIQPIGWPQSIETCEPGLYVTEHGTIAIKTEYEPYTIYVESGEALGQHVETLIPAVSLWEVSD